MHRGGGECEWHTLAVDDRVAHGEFRSRRSYVIRSRVCTNSNTNTVTVTNCHYLHVNTSTTAIGCGQPTHIVSSVFCFSCCDAVFQYRRCNSELVSARTASSAQTPVPNMHVENLVMLCVLIAKVHRTMTSSDNTCVFWLFYSSSTLTSSPVHHYSSL